MQLSPVKIGDSYQQLNEDQRARGDFQKAARLCQQQGNTTWYGNANDRIRQLDNLGARLARLAKKWF